MSKFRHSVANSDSDSNQDTTSMRELEQDYQYAIASIQTFLLNIDSLIQSNNINFNNLNEMNNRLIQVKKMVDGALFDIMSELIKGMGK